MRRNSNVYTDIAGTGITVIETSKGDVILIDTDARSLAERHTWSCLKTGHVRAAVHGGVKQKTVLLHRLVSPSMAIFGHIDHKNRDPRDCRLDNLRPCTKSENAQNQKIRAGHSTGVKGVSKLPSGMYRGRVHINGKWYSTKTCATLEEATVATMQKRNTIHGEFACHG